MKKYKFLITLLTSFVSLFVVGCNNNSNTNKHDNPPEINENNEDSNKPNIDDNKDETEEENESPLGPDINNNDSNINQDKEDNQDNSSENEGDSSLDAEENNSPEGPVGPEEGDSNTPGDSEDSGSNNPGNSEGEGTTSPNETEKDPVIDIEAELKKIDPFYPEEFNDRPYKFSSLPLKDRLTLSEDKKTATFFAPSVSKTSGFYDANKNFVNDISLCWAASCSNIIAWYLDQYKSSGYDLNGIETEIYQIFDHFRNNWHPRKGYDPLQGLAWYFTGKTLSGAKPDELLNETSGGYLTSLPHVGDTWSVLDPVNYYPIVGNYSEQYPFIDDNLTISGTHFNFSKQIITQLHYGPTSIAITKANTGVSTSHALTLWGCDYNVETGLINKIYITDSDDEIRYPGKHLSEIKVKSAPEPQGIEINYNIAGDTIFKRITTSTLLFHPDSVKKN